MNQTDKKQGLSEARKLLDEYLEMNHQRRTVERLAILDAIYELDTPVTLDELYDILAKDKNFLVSRPTLYACLEMFIKLRIVVRHRFPDATKYEAFRGVSHVYQICTECGRVKKIDASALAGAVDALPFNRFHNDGFILYVYGICSSCVARNTKLLKKRRGII